MIVRPSFNEDYFPNVGEVCKVYLWDINRYGKGRIKKIYSDKKSCHVGKLYDVEKIEWFNSQVTEMQFIDGAFDTIEGEENEK